MYYRQRLNQFPRSTELTRKDKLYDNIRRSSSMFGNVFNFVSVSMEHSVGKCPFIVKPVSSSRGQGIFFASKVVFLHFDFSLSSPIFVSFSLFNPLLINGYKFDLRIYVAVTSFYPLVVYVYSEGLTRVASEKYCSDVDSRNAFVHLTNYSINKNNSNFVRWDSLFVKRIILHCSKRTYFRNDKDIVVKSLLSVQARITSACRTTIPYIGTNYELFGFDILVDAQLKPWLLEVNLSPSLSCDAPLDSLVKTRLICDLFNLACVPLVNRKLAGIDSLHTFNENENGMSF
uniref:Tubulin--tyrosine ligase-like protein 5 n=1 Tax=Angiostrongylus cantonensis TaxID=6313 RepID=A0A158PA54_ANGCA